MTEIAIELDDETARRLNQAPKKDGELMPKELCEPDHWRHEGVFVCDGGDDFWGLEYDPESKAFSALEFNGVA